MRHMLYLSCMVLLILKPVTASRACPVFCHCSPDNRVAEPWALEAECKNDDIQVIPQLTPNITCLRLRSKRLTFIDGFAFAEALSLRIIQILASELVSIHKDAFQLLPNLVTIGIGSKHTIELNTGIFLNLPRLRTLSIRANLTHVPGKSLCPLSGMESFSLADNKITSVSFDPCISKTWRRLRLLNLSNNPLRNITTEDFRYLQDVGLTDLYMQQCKLIDLEEGLFQYLPGLTGINIGQNKITFFRPGIFNNLSNLKNLQIGQSHLTAMPFSKASHQLMQGLRELNIIGSTHLNLSFPESFLSATSLCNLYASGIHVENLHDTLFVNFINSPVKKLMLAECKIRRIFKGVFDPFQSLQELLLSRNPVDSDALKNASISLGKQPLRKLTIDNAHLKTLDSQTFSGFPPNASLTFLSMQHNGMERIGRGSFANLNQLWILKLRYNHLTNQGLEDGAFNGLDSLHTLDIGNNKISDMPRRLLLGIPDSLKTLELSYNQIGSLNYGDLKEWRNLTVLYLRHNGIRRLSSKLFGFFTELASLDLRENQITFVHETAFQDTYSLKRLQLDGNQLQNVRNMVFDKLSFLIVLSLGENELLAHTSDIDVFSNLSALQDLDINTCGIKTLPDNMFLNNGKLDILQMSSNSIVSWKPELFKPLQNLTILTMANNKIASVSKTAFVHLASLARLDLSGNPLACTCELLWFKHWINTANLYLVHYATKNRYYCASPEHQKGTSLIDFQLTEDDCSSHFLLRLIVGSLVGFLLVCTAISVTYRYRWYLRYYTFLMRSRRRQMQDALFEDEAFKYDVYVCYHNTSRRWVITELLPKLEHEAGIKLCLHDRDWLAGPAIMDNIIDSIEQSRKTLLLVNNGFASSGWCREETSLAYHRLMETQRNMLTVVLLEDVQQENMDKILRSILTKRVYLKFSQGKRRERRFWTALKAAPRKREHPQAGVELQRA